MCTFYTIENPPGGFPLNFIATKKNYVQQPANERFTKAYRPPAAV